MMISGITPKDVLECSGKHVLILIQNIMRWVGHDEAVRKLAPARQKDAGKMAEKWASNLRSIEETREVQRKRAQDTRQRLLLSMSRTVSTLTSLYILTLIMLLCKMEGRFEKWKESHSNTTANAPSDVLNAKSLVATRVAQAPPPVPEPPAETDMWSPTVFDVDRV